MKASRSCIVYAKVISFVIVTALPFTLQAQSTDEIAIKQLLDGQTNAWNNGNIDAFMKGYWQSDSLIFIGRTGLKYGYTTALENYKKAYPDTAAMGRLRFDLMQMKRLSSEYYQVTGKWTLQRTIGDLQGYFTLLFKKIKNSWVIISDHTS
jgi:ketosteroid isomerase-like protein